MFKGVVPAVSSVWLAVSREVATVALLIESRAMELTAVSAYTLLHASTLVVGVARLITLLLLRLTSPSGVVIELSGVVA